jgi:6-pyruvoyltetrahydropterin/6-carboxytetrahydropterin synthase
MFRVTKEIAFCFGHRLMNYDGKCRNLHGHNGRAVITVAGGDLDEFGMVTDFATMRKQIGDWIDRTLDHKMLLFRDDPLVPLLRGAGEQVVAMDEHPTTENIAKFIFDWVESEGYAVVEVTMWETPSSYATYQASSVDATVAD